MPDPDGPSQPALPSQPARPSAAVRLALVVLTLALAVGAALLGAGRSTPSPTPAPPEGRLIVGAPLGAFDLTDAAGQSVSSAGLRGRPLWLTFGASWCAPCRVEAPDIQAAYAAGRPTGLAVVAIYQGEDASAVTQFATTMGLEYAQVPDPQARLSAAYRIAGIPTHVFVDRAGVIRAVDAGVLSPAQIAERLAQL